ncbi:c-type cytochrome [Noviherbaspirillum sp.]|uniref:c-type cytochrome n=1 Tax=Noviherbaspirillum sp. TaxID=1926288 RepID=UPI002FE0BC7D
MRKVMAICIASGILLSPGAARADADLFRKSNCMACHAVDQKRFGPSLKDVAAKYSGDSSAVDKLAKKIQVGGAGVWGQVPMPPQPQISDADAKMLAEYILSIK